jgi:hypothetical protein
MAPSLYVSRFRESRPARCRQLINARSEFAGGPGLGVRAPDRVGKKAKCYLYPNELLQVVASEDVPLAVRRLLALAVYLFVRPGELEALTVPWRLSIITGELRKSIVGGPPNLASTIALHSPP